MTVGSTSIALRSDAGYPGKGRVGRSSHYSDARRSMNSHRGTLGPIVDKCAWLRSLQRRKIVEELIASEEGYIADLKILINVCHWNQYALETLSGACHDTTSSELDMNHAREAVHFEIISFCK
jgi:hypothetical protein